jgi:predicted HicB family RNase H-like nuclease
MRSARYHVSVSGMTYARLQRAAEKQGKSVRQLVEEAIIADEPRCLDLRVKQALVERSS